MSIHLATTFQTSPVYSYKTLLDTGLAAAGGAFFATLSEVLIPADGAVIGALMRISYKVNEIVLNTFFKTLSFTVGDGILLGVTRKIVEIAAAAAVTAVALSILELNVLPFSTLVMFSIVENLRPIHFGGYSTSGFSFSAGIDLRL